MITTLHRHAIEIVIVSDFHVDLRPWFASHGVLDCISEFAISYEVLHRVTALAVPST